NAGIAQDAADGIFQRKAVAAVDLQSVVGCGPGDARAQKLRHPRFQITAPALVLLARGVVAQLPRDRDFDRHHGELVAYTREFDERAAELLALHRVADAQIHRAQRDTDGARRGLNTCRLECLHQLFETLALLEAQQIRCRHFEAVKADLEFLLPAIDNTADFP